MHTLNESIEEVLKILLETFSGEKPSGITTGFADFDNLTRGMRKGSLTVLASKPSLGKTAFALNAARNLIVRNPEMPILYCSRLVHTDLAFRFLSIAAGTPCNYDHLYTAAEIKRLTDTVPEIRSRALHFAEIQSPDERFYAETAGLQAEKHFELLIVDPVQAADLPCLKQLAQKLQVPILALLGIQDRKESVPELDRADTVVILHRRRHECDPDSGVPVCFTVIRNCFGLCGTCKLHFFPRTMVFREIRYADAVDEV